MLDELRPDCLHDDEVPLALIGWEASEGITFVDHWSVRRRITRHVAADRFAPLAGDRLVAEGEARFLQFQEQVEDRVRRGEAASVSAKREFTRLPPAGLLRTFGPTPGFDVPTFFADLMTSGPLFVEGPRVAPLQRASLTVPPIDVASKELIWLYKVRENRDRVIARTGADRSYVLFATAHLPYIASAQYDVSHWDFANYAIDAW
jgi:hypothetical protein